MKPTSMTRQSFFPEWKPKFVYLYHWNLWFFTTYFLAASLSDTKKLWKNIEPHLKKALTTLYLREVSSSQWERYQQELEASDNAALQGIDTFINWLGDNVL